MRVFGEILTLSAIAICQAATTETSNLRGGSSHADDEGNNIDNLFVPRIVNGDEAPVGRYPYYTSINLNTRFGASHTCGGSLIHRDIVLTAAHCYNPRNARFTSVRVGAYESSDRDDSNGGQDTFFESRIERALVHPSYSTNTLNHDFALLKINPVDDPVLLGGMMNIDFSGSSDRGLEHRDPLSVVGLGRLYDGGPIAKTLQEVELKFVDQCHRYFRFGAITNEMMCAADVQERQDSCRGDSGGPLFLKGENAGADVQVGVVSWGPGSCASGHPAVYSRISSVSDWIEKEICLHSDFPPSSCPDQNEDAEDDPSVVPIEDNESDSELVEVAIDAGGDIAGRWNVLNRTRF
eukprot:CAMPEP_0178514438 /NCGR_PEP_ID=MMETSP0696-20121128/24014_1 /TAXON_ID=265572 /ORGANISM="Extubocellulus spinifer, Strain CCMP396" /LENGTH=350 /DNA_ID=CAMNT_0020144515 /DNA_START=484 /DNA_END=1534 /DNA_ORIENTATION=+